VKVYLFDHIPGMYPAWTMAVHAMSLPDARQYMRAWCRGGKYQGRANPGSKINANCGGTTSRAQDYLSNKMRQFLGE